MRYLAVGTTVAIERPGVLHLLGVMDCPTPEIAQREAARMNAPAPAPQREPVRYFDGDQTLLWEAD